MRLSNLVRRGEQSGQMLVSVIVLRPLMFFIGSAMALAVSSSLHTIAQTNSTDSVAYAAESAVAQGLARTATPVHSAPTVEYTQGGAIQAQPIGCNQGASDGEPGRGYNLDTGSHDNGDNNNQGSNNPGPAPLVVGGATWSYAYEVVADGDLVGRSDVGSDKQGPTSLALDNYETITIPWINIAGTVTLELYRTASGDPSLPLGCIGVYKQQPGGTGPKVHDTGPASPAPPMCTSPSAPPPSRQVNGYGPGGRQGPLMPSTCRVPIPLLASEPNSVQSWTEPGQLVPGNGACTPQPLSPPYSPTRN